VSGVERALEGVLERWSLQVRVCHLLMTRAWQLAAQTIAAARRPEDTVPAWEFVLAQLRPEYVAPGGRVVDALWDAAGHGEWGPSYTQEAWFGKGKG
jgi:hypothetical protein